MERYKGQWSALRWPAKLFAFATLVHTLFSIALAIYSMVTGENCSRPNEPIVACDRVYTSAKGVLIIIFSAFQCFNVWDGLFHDNLYELYAATITALLNTALQLVRLAEGFVAEPIDFVFLAEASTYQLLIIALAYPIYKEFSWRLHKKIGADPLIQTLYKRYLVVISLLKFDMMFVFLNIAVGGDSTFRDWKILAAEVAGALISIGFAILGWQAIKKENKVALGIWYFVALINPVYTIYFFTQIQIGNFGMNTASGYAFLTIAFIITGCIALLLRLTLVIFSFVVLRSFGQGLKETLTAHGRLKKARQAADRAASDAETIYVYEDEEINANDVFANTYIAANENPYHKM